jgi:hypothetical protein
MHECNRPLHDTLNISVADRSDGRNLSTAPAIAASPMCGANISPSSGRPIARQAASICGQAVIGCPCRVRSVPVAVCQYARTPLTLGCTYRVPDGNDSTVIYWQSIGCSVLRFTVQMLRKASPEFTRESCLYSRGARGNGMAQARACSGRYNVEGRGACDDAARGGRALAGHGIAPRLGSPAYIGRGGGLCTSVIPCTFCLNKPHHQRELNRKER